MLKSDGQLEVKVDFYSFIDDEGDIAIECLDKCSAESLSHFKINLVNLLEEYSMSHTSSLEGLQVSEDLYTFRDKIEELLSYVNDMIENEV